MIMGMVSNKKDFIWRGDGSKCEEYLSDLKKVDTMTWEDIYWRTSYIYTYGRDICNNQDLIDYFNECFNQGLSVNANQELYMSARKMQSAIYIAEEDFKMASNCIQAVLDITEDIPAEMFLDLTYAEIHTDLLRILKSPGMFFNDLHEADSNSDLLERQKTILCKLLQKAAEARSKDAKIAIDVAKIEKEVALLGLTTSEDYALFKKALGGEVVTIPAEVVHPKSEPKVHKKPTPEPIVEKPKSPGMPTRDKDGLLTIELFPSDEPKEEKKVEAPVPKITPPEIVDTKPDDSSKNTANNTGELKNIESMFASLLDAVKSNASQIADLHSKMQKISDDSEFAKIKAELEEGAEKNKSLQEQLAAANAQIVAGEQQLKEREDLLAKSEKQIAESQKQIEEGKKCIAEKELEKSELEKTIAAQNVLLEEKKNAEFSEKELQLFESFKRVIIIDTCAIMHQNDILEYVADDEMVRIPQTVLNELEDHKKNQFDKELSKIGQKCLVAIRSAFKRRKSDAHFEYEKPYEFLLPEAFKIQKDDEKATINDRLIFSSALRYKAYSKMNVLLISDDTTMLDYGDSEHIETMNSSEFISSRDKNITPTPVATVPAKPTKEEFLTKKLKYNEYTLTINEVQVLQLNGIKTLGDLISRTEADMEFVKDKRGFGNVTRFVQILNKVKRHYDSLFNE